MSIVLFGATTLSMTTFSNMTLSITIKNATLGINDIMLNVVFH